jgi:glucokinase
VAPPAGVGPQAVGIDIGGTKIAAGVVAEDGTILDRTRVPTPPDDESATLAALLAVVDELWAGNPGVEAIGVGAAGLVEWPGGIARWAPHNTYRRLELRRLLHERTGLPTIVDNDANAAALAEARFGAGVGGGDLVLVNVGTGIGGGLVLGGRLYHGQHGFAGELGHLIVDPDGDLCACGNHGCLEAMASGTTLGRLGREAAAADPGGRLAALAAAAGGPVTGEVVFAAAGEGDKAALALFERIGYWLGVGIASLVTIFDPDLVVVGGGVAATGELLLTPARTSFERYVHGRVHRDLPPVVPGRLGPDAGLVGAAALALARG